MKKYLLIFFVVIGSVTCMYGKAFASIFATNNIVHLTPQPPFEIQENDMLFRVQSHQDYWIYFEQNGNGYVDFTVQVDSNVLAESVKVNSLTIIVEDLDVTITKSNLDLPIKIIQSNTSNEYWGRMALRNIILTNDIVNEYNKQHNTSLISMELFTKFNKVNDVTFVIDVDYIVDGQEYSSILHFKYKPRNVTSSRLWDMFMSV